MQHQALVRAMITQNERLWTVSPALMKRAAPAVDKLPGLKVPCASLTSRVGLLRRPTRSKRQS
jgi:hypothetical protein